MRLFGIGNDRHLFVHFTDGKTDIGTDQIVVGDHHQCRPVDMQAPIGGRHVRFAENHPVAAVKQIVGLLLIGENNGIGNMLFG